ncbi:hypothetical protein [Ruminococcus flavefaciens]|jgi:hypothetical protein|uniref:Uncharacterized protein n=1 Tax=Ruminococcus flavefaciens TaxID=1265 RepID=A0A1K1PEL7_RUMFL|nr:hypothetical protein [Ruminococcus flavefaciens]SFW46031.1 hypothetical protein SAMN02910280_2715 [Ruminococcus flavefaciens]
MNTSKLNAVKRQKAKISAVLRVVVAVYFGYLAIKLMTNKDTTMDMATAWTFSALFILAALAIAGYSIYRFYCDFTASHIRKGSFDDDDFKNK